MKDLISFIVENITGTKDFDIEEAEESGRSVFTIKAPKEIIGLIIGKGGKTIKNIRKMAGVRGVIEGVSLQISVVEK